MRGFVYLAIGFEPRFSDHQRVMGFDVMDPEHCVIKGANFICNKLIVVLYASTVLYFVKLNILYFVKVILTLTKQMYRSMPIYAGLYILCI